VLAGGACYVAAIDPYPGIAMKAWPRRDAMANTTSPIDVDTLHERFIEYGLQYYTAGRCAVSTGLNPVAANIIHHAVEMFLKAGLCAHTTEDERRKLGHDLPKIWEKFKTHHDPKGALARFDGCVQGLHEFEDIRYPEGMMKPGSIVLRMQFANAPMPKDQVMLTGKPQPKEFSLEMSEIDTLIRAIYNAAGITIIMSHLIAKYREPGKTYLKQENAEADHLFK
jgi:hypothetical protein